MVDKCYLIVSENVILKCCWIEKKNGSYLDSHSKNVMQLKKKKTRN